MQYYSSIVDRLGLRATSNGSGQHWIWLNVCSNCRANIVSLVTYLLGVFNYACVLVVFIAPWLFHMQ